MLYAALRVVVALALAACSGGAGGGPSTVDLGTSGATGILPIGKGGTSGATAGSGFANLSPQTTKGDLIGYSTSPQRCAVGATGQILTSDSAATCGLSWQYDHVGAPGATGATAGYVGEVFTISRVRSNATAVASGATGATAGTNLGTTTSVTLTPGDWSCEAQCGFLAASTTTIMGLYCSVSATSATHPALDTTAVPTSGEARARFSVTNNSVMFAAADFTQAIPEYQVTVASGSTLPLFLVGGATFAVSTLTAYGSLQCRRMR